ncbi:MAG TPA: hypothetical protein P5519_12420 [Spirochaetia bacterium]|nr:hypothetical protein [Spirochaetales bacterium]HQG39934.1 hypothetical protein [Spirochaetales bacterium]HRS66678.1 hypothetical protein [Spirochaetia bacterium]HRV27836.1 hypothetical protein [Spirochaetia bacterium]
MNIAFFKISAGANSWLFILPDQLKGQKSKLAHELAKNICNPVEGLMTAGIIIPELTQDVPIVRVYSRHGIPIQTAGSSCLAAARWLLDNGLTNHEQVVMETFGGIVEILPIDMHFLGIEIRTESQFSELQRRQIPPSSAISPKLYLGSVNTVFNNNKVRVTLWDGPVPARMHLKVFMGSSNHIPEVHVGIINRETISITCFAIDPIDAAGLALKVCMYKNYAADELTVHFKHEKLIAQHESENTVFVGAEAKYSIKGEYWFQEEQ